jgi:hypothetical protein
MFYMGEKRIKKVNKNLYLPDWIAKILDEEGEKYSGPRFVASAAINAFFELSKRGKIQVLQKYKAKEIEDAYVNQQTATCTTQPHASAEETLKKIKGLLTGGGDAIKILDKHESELVGKLRELLGPENNKPKTKNKSG